MPQTHDRASVIITSLLAIIGVTVTPAKRRELENYLADELATLNANQRPTGRPATE